MRLGCSKSSRYDQGIWSKTRFTPGESSRRERVVNATSDFVLSFKNLTAAICFNTCQDILPFFGKNLTTTRAWFQPNDTTPRVRDPSRSSRLTAQHNSTIMPCSGCGGSGHNVRTCPKYMVKANKAAAKAAEGWTYDQVADYIAAAYPPAAPIVYTARFAQRFRDVQRQRGATRKREMVRLFLDAQELL